MCLCKGIFSVAVFYFVCYTLLKGGFIMLNFFSNIGGALEDFFATSAMTVIGVVFLVVITLLILLIIRYYEK